MEPILMFSKREAVDRFAQCIISGRWKDAAAALINELGTYGGPLADTERKKLRNFCLRLLAPPYAAARIWLRIGPDEHDRVKLLVAPYFERARGLSQPIRFTVVLEPDPAAREEFTNWFVQRYAGTKVSATYEDLDSDIPYFIPSPWGALGIFLGFFIPSVILKQQYPAGDSVDSARDYTIMILYLMPVAMGIRANIEILLKQQSLLSPPRRITERTNTIPYDYVLGPMIWTAMCWFGAILQRMGQSADITFGGVVLIGAITFIITSTAEWVFRWGKWADPE